MNLAYIAWKRIDRIYYLAYGRTGLDSRPHGQRLVPDCPSFREGTQIPKSYTIGKHILFSLPQASI